METIECLRNLNVVFFFWHHRIIDVKGGNYGLFVNLAEVVVPHVDCIVVSVVVIFASPFHFLFLISSYVGSGWLFVSLAIWLR